MKMLLPTISLAAIVLVAGLFSFVGGFFIIHGFFSDAPFVPSSSKKRRAMLDLARVHAGETIIDAGSGDGSLVIASAGRGAHAIGIESNPLLVFYSRIRILRNTERRNITIIRGNLFSQPFHSADILFLYLFPKTIEKLKEKLEKELKPGCRVVSNTFPIPGWTPEKEQDDVFLYIKREKSSTI
ncbi:MAG: hypothetical protein UX94_C0007G0012 [Parcubacteria group bacterium GW2011_GWA2_47_21]|nr:MAG: hypothetical protein UX94_C0007G0012 [Parcubacteria group bacterium GW2011_GWA2_47_21]